MFKKCFVSLVVLWSCSSSMAVVHNPFEFFNEKREGKTSKVCDTSKPIKMAPERSQGDIPICGAYSSAAVIQFQVCKKFSGACIDGVPTSAKTTVSPLSTLTWMRPNPGKNSGELSSDFTSLKFYTTEVGGAADVLLNASKFPSFFSESCFPIDQLVNRFDNKDFKKIISTIETEYSKAKLEGDGICVDCLKGSALETSAKALGISSEKIAEKLVEAKKEDASPSQYLQKLMLENCPDKIKFRPSQAPKVDYFPRQSADFTYEKLIGKVKEVLSGGNPLTMDNICIEYKADGSCKTFHSVAISGYRKVCKNIDDEKDKCSVQCRDVVKVHNSWGADWQKRLEIAEGKEAGDGEGWVDAKKLTEYMTKNRSFMKNSLAWYY